MKILLHSFYMTTKTLEKKVARLESVVGRLQKRIVSRERARVKQRQNEVASVLKRTSGVVTKKRGAQLLKQLKRQKKSWNAR